ncbi:OLC1v1002449C1 [Oldenlandia corymbosa var. corymbosa]|nr:OLC1v1002449C1 [Oldenlandia corymbosa var. corymbosa]
MESLLTHIQGFAVDAARSIFMFSCDQDFQVIAELGSKPLVCGMYVKVLQASKLTLSPLNSTPALNRLALRELVDSLLSLLWQLLPFNDLHVRFVNPAQRAFSSFLPSNDLSSFYASFLKNIQKAIVPSVYRLTEIFHHQMQKLYGGLTFLKAILDQQGNDQFDELYNKKQGLIRSATCEAGIIIFYLFEGNQEGGSSVKKLEALFSKLEKSFELIRELATQIHPLPLLSAAPFPQTNLSGCIHSVLQKMKSISEDKFQTVQDDVTFVTSFLEYVVQQFNQNEKLQALQSRIAAVAYETEFFLDSLVIGEALQSLVVILDAITQEIKLIKAEVEASQTFHAQKQITRVGKTSSRMRPAGDHVPLLNEVSVGLKDETQTIIYRLKRGVSNKLDIVSIVGMPGIGKTNMAMKVYGDSSISYHFHVRSWSRVSQVFNKKSVLLEILSCLPEKHVHHSEKSEDDLALDLYRSLKGKRYLIILDDVWDVAVWDSLRIVFPDDSNGSRILLTSRHADVALKIKPDSQPLRLRLLSDDESWELMQKNTCFGEGCHPELLKRGMAITKHCRGLPLMILIVGGLLSNIEPDTWEEVEQNLEKGTLSLTEQCRETLELSYQHLPEHLKQCFLYFRAFQKDQILVRKVLWLWMGEGFVVKQTESQCLEDVARSYMMELIQRNLVMVGKKGSRGRVKSCILHDILYDFCLEKCIEAHFMHCPRMNDSGTSIKPNILLYRLCLHSWRGEGFAWSRLRTLLVNDHGRCHPKHWYDMLHQFWQSKLLRVLDLRTINIGHFFLTGIELLLHLRYLALKIEGEAIIIPPSIANLSNLETFIFDSVNFNLSLPDTIWTMKNLRHLHLTGFAHLKLPEENPEYASNLENLETLSTVQFSSVQKMNEALRKFPKVRRFKCSLLKVGDIEECTILALDAMNQLESLTIFPTRSSDFQDRMLESPIPGFRDYLNFQFPQNLKKLAISGFQLPWSRISAIDGLPHLEVLKLLSHAFSGEEWYVEEGKFPKLRYLKLSGLDLARWISPEDDSFPCLEKLVMERCRWLAEVPTCLANVLTLQSIEVTGCESVAGAIEEIKEMQMDTGNDDLKVLIKPSLEDENPTTSFSDFIEGQKNFFLQFGNKFVEDIQRARNRRQ